MAEPAFSDLRRRLIHGGVSPRRVARLLRELRDHYAALVLEQQRAGSRTPAEEALARLGTDESLAAQFLAKPELLSWSRRWPWAVYGVAPLLVFPAAFVATIFAMVGLVGLAHLPHGANAPPPLLAALRAFRFFDLYVLPVVLAAGFALLATSRRVSTAWPWVSLALVTFFGGILNLDVRPHQIGAGIGFATRLSFLSGFLVHRWIPIAASAVLLYFLALSAARHTRELSV